MGLLVTRALHCLRGQRSRFSGGLGQRTSAKNTTEIIITLALHLCGCPVFINGTQAEWQHQTSILDLCHSHTAFRVVATVTRIKSLDHPNSPTQVFSEPQHHHRAPILHGIHFPSLAVVDRRSRQGWLYFSSRFVHCAVHTSLQG